MACISNHRTFFGKGFQGMAGNEPSGLYVVFREQLQQPANADRTSKETFES